jgi:sphingomyelin phosphodiesterase
MTFPSRDALIFCNTMYSECSLPPVEEYTIISPKPKPALAPRAVSGKEPFKMVHISDIHFDLSYDPGTSYHCTYEICCRADTNYTSLGSQYQAGP